MYVNLREFQYISNTFSITDSIENNIENTQGRVELGTQELIKASNYQSKFRRKLCILLTIVIIFVIILILCIVLANKSS